MKADKNKKPACSFRPCPVSHLMTPDVDLFVSMFFLLKSEIFKRQPFELLDRAGAREEDYDLFAVLQAHVAALQEKQR